MKRVMAVMVLAGFLVLSVVFYSRTYSRVAAAVSNASGGETKPRVVIDPGHGGNDPGRNWCNRGTGEGCKPFSIPVFESKSGSTGI